MPITTIGEIVTALEEYIAKRLKKNEEKSRFRDRKFSEHEITLARHALTEIKNIINPAPKEDKEGKQLPRPIPDYPTQLELVETILKATHAQSRLHQYKRICEPNYAHKDNRLLAYVVSPAHSSEQDLWRRLSGSEDTTGLHRMLFELRDALKEMKKNYTIMRGVGTTLEMTVFNSR